MFKRSVLFLVLCTGLLLCRAQIVRHCPPNIGFEDGGFSGWRCYTGYISQTDNVYVPSQHPTQILVDESGPVPGRHTLITGGTDPYGKFSLKAPDGSKYVVRLGNSGNGHQAERMSYTLTVPKDITSYSVIFNYAVVLQNPNHQPDEQPKFTVTVTNLSRNTPTSCGSFEFIASSGLPGFKQADDPSVVYRPWSPVMVNLSDYPGDTIMLEFTTNDCSHMQHFGYAYIDFNDNCSIPVLGNITCPTAPSITLKTIEGFESYRWYDETNQQELGSSQNLTLSPVPPVGTKIAVDLIPYSGLGCMQTLHTEVTDIYMVTHSPPESCLPVDITAISVTEGNSTDLSYTYWRDPAAKIPLDDPKAVFKTGTYYIKGTSSSGCEVVKPVDVKIKTLFPVEVTDPPEVDYPTTVDITATFVHDPDLRYTYWRNAACTIPLDKPDKVRFSGTYYIKGDTPEGCQVSAPVNVIVHIRGIIIPNTFTPNNDGYNDVFTILAENPASIKLLSIYNRWGVIVYETPEITRYWDGRKDDKNVPPGVYYYVLVGSENNKTFRRSGYVTVIR